MSDFPLTRTLVLARVWAALWCRVFLVVTIALMLGASGFASAQGTGDDATVKRGEYLFNASGCRNCHTDTKNKVPLLAGGAPIKTEFGIFFGPNITPHRERGIGSWTDAQFIRAMREGISPDGRPYYPAFPYTAFTGMSDRDLLDLKAYIFSLPPVARASKPHDLRFPFSIRAGLTIWKMLFFTPGPLRPDPSRSKQWNRGRYLAEALVHCAECHTPRNMLGALKTDYWLAGASDGPEGSAPPNITPDRETGIGKWSEDDLVESLSSGMLPDGDEFGELMADVVEHGTAKLTDEDRRAIAVYIRALKPVRHEVGKK